MREFWPPIWRGIYYGRLFGIVSNAGRLFDYIHYNPMKHGLAECPRDWPYSTFHRDVARGIYPLDWAGLSDVLDLAIWW